MHAQLHIASRLTGQIFAQGNVDNEGQLSARFNYRWTDGLVTKSNIQIAPGEMQSVLQLEHEYTGRDFSASLKMLNPSVLDGGLTGIYIGSYLQSITPSLSLGLEAVWQRPVTSQPPEAALSYNARYASNDWAATAQIQPHGTINTTFWRRLTENVQAGIDTTLSLVPSPVGLMGGGGLTKEGVTTFGAKYDFHMSTFRAQIDTHGKLGVVLEKRVAAPVTMTFAADVDHATVSIPSIDSCQVPGLPNCDTNTQQQQAKVGLGVSVEAGGEEAEVNPDGSPVHPPPNNIPF